MTPAFGEVVTEDSPALPSHGLSVWTQYPLHQRLRSGYHALWYRLGERLSWSRGTYREPPAYRFDHLTGCQQARIAWLSKQFSVRFEQHCGQATALRNYDYLDILEQTWSAWGQPRPVGGVVQDIGSSNFWYARALHAFFRPAGLTGVEIEGHRIYRNGYSRLDYARGYVEGLPNTQFVNMDYRLFDQPADVVTAWYPFVTPAPVLAWRLPLSLLAPQAIFSRIARNLRAEGVFVMINQGIEETTIAATLCSQAGLEFQTLCEVRSTLRPRRLSPVVSWWRVHTVC
jgi:hypothetical protein